MAAGIQLGALSLWGDNVDAEPRPVLNILSAHLAQALATERLGRRAVEQRARSRRLSRAVRAIRDLDVADRGLGRLVDASCMLVGGVGAILVSGRRRTRAHHRRHRARPGRRADPGRAGRKRPLAPVRRGPSMGRCAAGSIPAA